MICFTCSLIGAHEREGLDTFIWSKSDLEAHRFKMWTVPCHLLLKDAHSKLHILLAKSD